jgi:SAM-dependent methyltransferase
MHGLELTLARTAYRFAYGLLQASLPFNPLFRKSKGGRKIICGHIRHEQETDPRLDRTIIHDLVRLGVPVQPHRIDENAFRQFAAQTPYPDDYFGRPGKEWLRIEKTLEHFVSIGFLESVEGARIADIGAGHSPFFRILTRRHGARQAYAVDPSYAPSCRPPYIRARASRLPFAPESLDALALHCSFEHFEGAEDLDFLAEAERVLRPGGRCVVLPLYLSSQYTVHLDPVFNLLRGRKPDLHADPGARLRYCNSRQPFSRHYDARSFKERILDATALQATVYHLVNHKSIHRSCYLRFAAVFRKPGSASAASNDLH